MGIYTFTELGIKYKLSKEAIEEFRKIAAVTQVVGILIGIGLATGYFVFFG